MFSYIARQAIFDKQLHVFAYELLFRDGEDNAIPDIESNEKTAKIIANSHFSLGIEEITDGKGAFINFQTDTLLYRFPTMLEPHTVIVELASNTEVSKTLIEACRHIKGLGYRFAISEYDFDAKWDPLLAIINFIKIDVTNTDLTLVENNKSRFDQGKIKLVATEVESQTLFTRCSELGFDFYQGYFFAKPETHRQKNIPSAKLNLLDLMRESANQEFDFDKIRQIVEKDVALSFMLLRFINNPIMNKRNKINSLSHALNYMGEVEIKKFIALVAIANLSDEKPTELIRLSLARAKLCELISLAKQNADNPPKGYLVGLFSLLDALLDQDMSKLLRKLPLSDDLNDALNGVNGQLRDYLVVARAFEYGDWKGVSHHSTKLELDQDMLHSFYNESIKWASALASSIRQ
ncbi:HDOD domain-containing protein [Aliiglaciecola sp. 3_MG-2023]|uniref:EAL and HDOD domain-containing protein n=1 Tax=Aliiglaciecola sp. 3_MG-2023 TaxID=3062644 RepID=UPI0026E28845|nr:HDOD domain-containing protein [Aliiglaciecola sp. 3_MG-2023]MDO6692367.1 HDOD domain-containing protein [Aliiglaciecola sp. 3_MG-2023]